MITSLNIPAPDLCELCNRDPRIENASLCVSCMDLIGRLVNICTRCPELLHELGNRKAAAAGGAR